MTHEHHRKRKPLVHRTVRTQTNMTGEQSQTNSHAPLQISSTGEIYSDHKEKEECSGCPASKLRPPSHIPKIQAQVGIGRSRGSGLSITHRLIAIVLAILMLISGPRCHYNYERLVKGLGDLRKGETIPLHVESVPPLCIHSIFSDHPNPSYFNEDLRNTSKQKHNNKRLKNIISSRSNCSCDTPNSQKWTMFLNDNLEMDYDKSSGCGETLSPDAENHFLVSSPGYGRNNFCSSKPDKKWTFLNVSRRSHREKEARGGPSARWFMSGRDTFLSTLLRMKCSCHLAEGARVFSGGSIQRLPPPNRGRVPLDGKWHTKTSEKYYTNPKGARITKASHFNLQYVLGHKIAFMCVARGAPLPHITWFKDGVELYAHKYMQLHEWTRGHKLKSKMEIDPASQADAGIYECHANNKYAIDSRAFRTTYLAEFN